MTILSGAVTCDSHVTMIISGAVDHVSHIGLDVRDYSALSIAHSPYQAEQRNLKTNKKNILVNTTYPFDRNEEHVMSLSNNAVFNNE